MLLKIPERFLEIGVQFLFAHTTYHATAGAISTITCAAIRHQKQDPVWIPMHKPRNWHVRILAARVSHVVRGCPRLFDPWNHLSPDRIIGIIARDQIEKMRGHRQREFVS
jgi:hypothetical protein